MPRPPHGMPRRRRRSRRRACVSRPVRRRQPQPTARRTTRDDHRRHAAAAARDAAAMARHGIASGARPVRAGGTFERVACRRHRRAGRSDGAPRCQARTSQRARGVRLISFARFREATPRPLAPCTARTSSFPPRTRRCARTCTRSGHWSARSCSSSAVRSASTSSRVTALRPFSAGKEWRAVRRNCWPAPAGATRRRPATSCARSRPGFRS